MEYGELMGAGKSAETGWRQTTVLIRSDIFAAAEREHLDISDACNRALAGQLGIDGHPAKKTIPEKASRVIIAQDTAPGDRAARAPAAPPVINAEDPTVPGKVTEGEKGEEGPVSDKTAGTPAGTGPAAPGGPRTPGTDLPQYHKRPERKAKKRSQ